MHHPTDRIAHTTAFVTSVTEHWLEREIAQWVQPMKDRSDDPSHHERTLLPRSYIQQLEKYRIRLSVGSCISDCLAFTSLTAVISILNQVTVRLSVKCGDKRASVDVYIRLFGIHFPDRSNINTKSGDSTALCEVRR